FNLFEFLFSLFPFERRADRSIEKRNNLRRIVGNGIDVEHTGIAVVVEILLRLGSGEETPAAVVVVVRIFPVHEPDSGSVNGDQVCRETGPISFCEGLNLLGRESTWFVVVTD